MQKKSSSSDRRSKRQYKTPRLTTHGTVAKLTQRPDGPKKNGRWSWNGGSEIF